MNSARHVIASGLMERILAILHGFFQIPHNVDYMASVEGSKWWFCGRIVFLYRTKWIFPLTGISASWFGVLQFFFPGCNNWKAHPSDVPLASGTVSVLLSLPRRLTAVSLDMVVSRWQNKIIATACFAKAVERRVRCAPGQLFTEWAREHVTPYYGTIPPVCKIISIRTTRSFLQRDLPFWHWCVVPITSSII
jgi:hypothetical protein